MKHITDICLLVVVFYIIPMVICAVFATWHNRDNPFKKGSKSLEWVFTPAANVLCAAVVVYYVCIELVIKGICKWTIKKIKKWNKE